MEFTHKVTTNATAYGTINQLVISDGTTELKLEWWDLTDHRSNDAIKEVAKEQLLKDLWPKAVEYYHSIINGDETAAAA